MDDHGGRRCVGTCRNGQIDAAKQTRRLRDRLCRTETLRNGSTHAAKRTRGRRSGLRGTRTDRSEPVVAAKRTGEDRCGLRGTGGARVGCARRGQGGSKEGARREGREGGGRPCKTKVRSLGWGFGPLWFFAAVRLSYAWCVAAVCLLYCCAGRGMLRRPIS